MKQNRQIGKRLRAFRLERQLTQEQLAEMIDRTVETISNLERGISLPSRATLHRLAQCLQVSPEDLLVERETIPDDRPDEYFHATEILKMLDPKKLKLAYGILKLIAKS